MNEEASKGQVIVTAAPDWAAMADWNTIPVPEPEQGVSWILVEDCLNAANSDAPEQHRFFHRSVCKVVSRAGIESAANFSSVFDPLYQSIEVHHIRVWRDGVAIDHADTNAIKLLHREQSKERLIYDGRKTADLTIVDVRPGDVIELSHTLVSHNPVLDGLIDVTWRLSYGVAVGRTVCSVITQGDRVLAFENFGLTPDPVITTVDDTTRHVWTLDQVAATNWEPCTPTWYHQGAVVQIADTATWGDIATRFAPLYPRSPSQVWEMLRPELEAITAKHPNDQSAQAIEALKFCQREVRYLALSMGDGGLVPRALDDIWASRLGDCKDKSLLLVNMLEALGIPAAPFLVNSAIDPALKGPRLPGPGTFDHCVVLVTLDGKDLVLDPTMQEQSGTVKTITKPVFTAGLPLVPGADLKRLKPDRKVVWLDFDEHWDVPLSYHDPVVVRAKQTSRNWQADNVRANYSFKGRDQFVKDRLAGWQQSYGEARWGKEPELIDRGDENEVDIIEEVILACPYIREPGDPMA